MMIYSDHLMANIYIKVLYQIKLNYFLIKTFLNVKENKKGESKTSSSMAPNPKCQKNISPNLQALLQCARVIWGKTYLSLISKSQYFCMLQSFLFAV